ncbi:MAG: hypothetical protein KGJ13_08530 [Patescibacteria group bacterium]|nr:hypothetical protein [Patescibacteria group bacterium]
MKLPTENARNFALQMRQSLMGSQAQRARDSQNWDALFYSGATMDKDEAAIVNIVSSRIKTQAGNLFSPDHLTFRLEYGVNTPEPVLLKAQTAGSEISRELREADADLEFSDCVELALRHGCSFGQLQWESTDGGKTGSFACDAIQQSSVGVLNERAKSLHDQPAVMVSYSIPAEEFKTAVLKFRGTTDVASAFDNRDGSAATQMNDATRVVLGLNQPISSASTSQAGFVNILPRPPFIPSANSRGRQVAIDAIWFHEDDGTWATVYVVEGNETIGTDRWRNFLALDPTGDENKILAKRIPYFYVCPVPVKGSFFGRSMIADFAEAQDYLRRHTNGLDNILSRREDPSYVGFGAIQPAEIYRQQLRNPGGFVTETGPNAKVQEFAPQMPPEIFEALGVVAEFASDAANAPPIVQGRGEKGVRAGAHAETLMLAASSRERRPALRTVRQCGDMGDLALDIWRVKDASILSSKGGDFTAESLPNGFHVYCNGFTASPMFAAEYLNKISELVRVGAIGPEQVLDLINIEGYDLLRNALEKREAAQAKFLQEHPEVVTKMASHRR